MRKTKKLTLGAMMIAIGVLFMALGYFIEALDLTVAALLSLIMAFMFIEVGSPYTYAVWLGTSALGAVFFTGSFVWLTYFLIFGIYPILKAYIEKLPRGFWLIVKLVFFNIAFVLLIVFSEFILGTPFFTVSEGYEDSANLIKAAFAAAFNVAFVIYDIFMTLMIKTYLVRFRPKFSRLLK